MAHECGDSSAAGPDTGSGLGSAGLVAGGWWLVASGGLPRHRHYLVDWTCSRARPSQHTEPGHTGTLGRRGRGASGGGDPPIFLR